MYKLRVGVLMGGKSIEREVSFNSGRTVCDHLDTTHYEIIPIFQTSDGILYLLPWQFLHRGKISDFEHRLSREATIVSWDHLKQYIDFMYIATHGRYAEDGTLQGTLELFGIPYLGSKVLASALSMDKIMQKKILAEHNIPIPRYIVVTPTQIENFETHEHHIKEQLAATGIVLPYIVKPYKEGSSIGISVIFDHLDIKNALTLACTIHPAKKQSVIIEEKIEGMEFSCITLTDYHTNTYISLTPTEIALEENTHFFDYEQKYMPGRGYKYTPPRCENEVIKNIQATCLKTMQALEMTNFSRIDGFVTADKRIVITDPNTLSGMGPTSFLFREAAEINMGHSQLINHLIETELYSYGMNHASFTTHEDTMTIMQQSRKKVAVLMGGASNEKETSLDSGRNVVYKLSPHKYEVIPLFLTQDLKLYRINHAILVRNSTKEIESLVQSNEHIAWSDLPNIADFVFNALHGGFGENGVIQGFLEMINMPYNGSGVLTSALCMDKWKTSQYLKHTGFDVPQGMLIDKNNWLINSKTVIERICEQLSFPLVVKPHDDGCSVMVQKATDVPSLSHAIETIVSHGKSHVLIEEFIKGMELTVGVLGNESPQALPPSKVILQKDILSIEEKFLPGAGENQTPAPLGNEALEFIKDTIEDVYKTLDCKGYARIDCFYQHATLSPTRAQRLIILEINTLPGLTPATCLFHQAAEKGMRPMDLLDTIIEYGFKEHHLTSLKQNTHQTTLEINKQEEKINLL